MTLEEYNRFKKADELVRRIDFIERDCNSIRSFFDKATCRENIVYLQFYIRDKNDNICSNNIIMDNDEMKNDLGNLIINYLQERKEKLKRELSEI